MICLDRPMLPAARCQVDEISPEKIWGGGNCLYSYKLYGSKWHPKMERFSIQWSHGVKPMVARMLCRDRIAPDASQQDLGIYHPYHGDVSW